MYFDPSNLEYRLIFKFDRLSHFRQWESSEVRQGYLNRINRLTKDTGQFQILTGLESWFTLSTKGAIAALQDVCPNLGYDFYFGKLDESITRDLLSFPTPAITHFDRIGVDGVYDDLYLDAKNYQII